MDLLADQMHMFKINITYNMDMDMDGDLYVFVYANACKFCVCFNSIFIYVVHCVHILGLQ